MGDEQVGQPQALLQILQQVQDLRLNRDIERAGRLVADEQLGLDCERARNSDALALPAGELVRIAILHLRRETDLQQQLVHPLARARWAPAPSRSAAMPSSTISSTRMRGLSEL